MFIALHKKTGRGRMWTAQNY